MEENDYYLVTIVNLLDEDDSIVLCKTKSEFANLLLNIDESMYQLCGIEHIGNIVESSNFIKKDKDLEFGL